MTFSASWSRFFKEVGVRCSQLPEERSAGGRQMSLMLFLQQDGTSPAGVGVCQPSRCSRRHY
nr:MAG TPA: hypothetical protein [Caudoviricetes sp.]